MVADKYRSPQVDVSKERFVRDSDNRRCDSRAVEKDDAMQILLGAR